MTTITSTVSLPDQAALQGLNMQALVQQALSGLPQDASPAEKQAAIRATIAQATVATAPGAAPAHARKRTKFFDLEETFKRMEAERRKNDTVRAVLEMGSGASTAELESALSRISFSDAGYARLHALLHAAQEREVQAKQQQQVAAVGGLNVMG